jgi:hypothetical protein
VHVHLALDKVDVLPAEPAKLGRPQAGEQARQEQRPPPAGELADDRAHLGRRGDIHADLELAALLGL